MPIATTAVFESGMLRPTEPLALPEHSLVHLVIVTPTQREAVLDHASKLTRALAQWRSKSEVGVLSAPATEGAQARELDDEFDRLLDEIGTHTADLPTEEVEALAAEACRAARDGG